MTKAMAFLMALGAVGPAFLLAGCSEIDQKEFDELQASVKNLQIKEKNDNELQVHLYQELVRNHGNLVKQVTELDSLVKTMQTSVERLEQQVKVLMATRQVAQPPDGPAAPPSKPASIEEIQLNITTTLAELRSEKLGADDAAKLLLPYAVHAAPKVLDELAGAVTKFEYAKQLESILSKFPADALRAPFQKALAQRGLRESVVRVIGQTRNPELGRLLEDLTDSGDEDFKLLVGESLVHCRNAKGIPILIASLRSGETTTRTIAIAALKRLTRGQDFGFRAQGSAEANGTALKSWEEWFEKGGNKVFD